MQLPKKIKIGPHTFKVVFPFRFDHNKELCGQIDSTVNEIRIAARNQEQDYVASNVWVTLIHEIVHHIFGLAGVKQDEVSIDIAAHMVLAILIDNGWLKPELPPLE